MKTVFVFGAGASVESGAPLMANFLDKAEALLMRGGEGISFTKEESDAFKDVIQARKDLRLIHDKSNLEIDNIEALFGAIEMGAMIGKLCTRNVDNISQLRSSILTVIVKTLEYSMPYPVIDRKAYPPPIYQEFAGNIADLAGKNKDYYDFSFITFNYDLALDYALASNGFLFDYNIAGAPAPNTYSLLKLHGSINWGQCPKCKKNTIKPCHISKPAWPEAKRIYYNLGTQLSNEYCCEGHKYQPLVIPPTWNKAAYHSNIASVWKKAALELADADNIIIIGYSMPSTDMFFKYLYALGSESEKRIKRLWVVNPDGNTERHFRDLIGRGIENRFKYIPKTFSDFIGHIKFLE
jgi:NAD-dependent SIR2 family protein deacetylase